MKDVLIYGASGLGSLTLDILMVAGQFRPIGFLDSDREKLGTIVDGLPVLGGLDAISATRIARLAGIVVAVGDGRVRAALGDECRRRGLQLISAIHPLASISPSATVGAHVIIGARSTVCVNVSIGDHAIISAGCIVDHDCVLEQGAFLHPAVRLAGGVRVGRNAVLHIGSSVIPGRKIGDAALVGPGSVVIRDVPSGLSVQGVPAQQSVSDTSRFVADRAPPIALAAH
ncbi:MAG: NeuD/PglB/VioB family sugar acetyltransferase [Phycisphaerae bacterium]